jgi:hypothetical protein
MHTEPFPPHPSTQHHKTYLDDKVSLKILKRTTPAKQKDIQPLFQPLLSRKKWVYIKKT